VGGFAILQLQLFVSHHTDTLFTSSPVALASSAIINNNHEKPLLYLFGNEAFIINSP
jgi:hypothetical protein